MKAKITTICLFAAFAMFIFSFSGCKTEGPIGPAGYDGADGKDGKDGLDTEVYYSEWFSPQAWLGESGDWYFEESAPDLTENVVESGLILAYVWLAGDLYKGTTVRQLPDYALGANWSYLIHEYKSIQFTCDMIDLPLTTGNKFRFIAIPGNIPALKSASLNNKTVQELRSMSYKDVCKLFNIPE